MRRNRKLENLKLKIIEKGRKMGALTQRLNMLRMYDKCILSYLEFVEMGTLSDDSAQEAIDALEASQCNLIHGILEKYTSEELEDILSEDDFKYLDTLMYFLDIFN